MPMRSTAQIRVNYLGIDHYFFVQLSNAFKRRFTMDFSERWMLKYRIAVVDRGGRHGGECDQLPTYIKQRLIKITLVN